MLRTIWAQLRHGRGRGAFAAIGILVASVSFSLLTAAAATNTAKVEGIVSQNLRPAYDILVRPQGSTTSLEESSGLVRANYLSGIFGGITLQQYDLIRALPGVQVAAPIAMVGYILQGVLLPVDATVAVGTADSQVLTITGQRVTDRGLTKYPARSFGYIYVTKDPLASPGLGTHFTIPAGEALTTASTETLPTGAKVSVCRQYVIQPNVTSPFADTTGETAFCFSQAPSSTESTLPGLPAGHVGGIVSVEFPFLVAAIDPSAEQQLVGLGNTVVGGRYLRDTDGPGSRDSASTPQVPVLATASVFDDDQDQITVSRLPAEAVELVRGGEFPDQLAPRLERLSATPIEHLTITSQAAYRALLQQLGETPSAQMSGPSLDAYWTTSSVDYRRLSGGELEPIPVSNPDTAWVSDLYAGTGYEPAPIDSMDVSFRTLYEHLGSTQGAAPQLPALHTVGEFDPAKLPGFSALSQVPLETYYPPQASGANAASHAALGGQVLLPNANIAGYLQQPPLLLTTLRSLPAFEQAFPTSDMRAPISVIRVRVGGLKGTARQQLDEIGRVAASIRAQTGLVVDVTAGSSPTAETIALPPGRYGRPALTLDELWVHKAVALVVLAALDVKSLGLFILIVVVCAFFLGNAAFAAARSRRSEIGVLRCLGWSRRAIFSVVLGELLAIAILAGLAGTILSAALIAGLHLEVPFWRVLLVVPTAVLLAAAAGLAPAWRAAASQPLDAVLPTVRRASRASLIETVASLALSNVRRTPARLALSTAALGMGIAALTVLLAISSAFARGIAGSLLGGYVTSDVRAVDYLSAVLAVLLGATSVGDVLYLNIRERAAEMAVLTATGWRRRHIARLVIFEGLLTGALGSILGALTGLAGATALLGNFSSLLGAASAAAASGLVVTLVAAALVTAMVLRMPLLSALADE